MTDSNLHTQARGAGVNSIAKRSCARRFGRAPQRRSGLHFAALFAAFVLGAGSAAIAADDSARHFEIKATGLADALMEFGVQSGLTVVAPTTLTDGKKATPVRGDLAPTDALGRLLSGSGLTFARAGDGTIGIQAIGAGASAQAGAGESSVETDETKSASLTELVVLGKGEVRSVQTMNADIIAQQPPLMDPIALISRLPGVVVGAADAFNSDDWSTDLEIRGFNRDRIGFTVDGMPMGASDYRSGTRPDRFVDNENMKSVTVVQGASDTGALSTQSLGGSIQYVTIGPRDEFGGTADYTTGNFDVSRYFLRVDSGAFLGGNTSAYASYSDMSVKAWMDYGAGVANTRQHFETAILQKLSGDNSLQLKYVYNNRFGYNYNQVTVQQWRENPWSDGIHGPWTGNPGLDAYNAQGWTDPTKDHMASVTGKFVLPYDVKMSAVGYYHDTDGPGTWPYECIFQPASLQAPSPGPKVCNRDANGVATLETMYISEYKYNREGLTLRFDKTIANHTLAVGAWYEVMHREWNRTYNQVLNPLVGPAWGPAYFVEFDRLYHTKTKTAFLDDNISFLDDRLHANAGVNLVSVDIDYHNILDAKGRNTYSSGNTVAPRAGLVYTMSHGLEVYASYAKNFRALKDGELTNRAVSGVNTETANSYEAGVRYKARWLDLTFSAYKIIFNNRIINFAFTVPPEVQGSRAYTPDGIEINAGGMRTSGVELGAQIRLPYDFQLYLSASRNDGDAALVNSVTTDQFGQLASVNWVNQKNRDLSGFAELSFTSGNFHAAMNGNYVGFREGTTTGALGAPAYWVAGANAGYTVTPGNGPFKSISFTMSESNLFNEKYLSGIPTVGRFFIGAPRTLTATVSARF